MVIHSESMHSSNSEMVCKVLLDSWVLPGTWKNMGQKSP